MNIYGHTWSVNGCNQARHEGEKAAGVSRLGLQAYTDEGKREMSFLH